jgi:hypothetical protein
MLGDDETVQINFKGDGPLGRAVQADGIRTRVEIAYGFSA